MPGLDELMARGDAAGGMMRDGGMAPGGENDAPPPDIESQPSDDLDGALAQVESVVEGLNPDIADQVRDHLNAIRELVASAGAPKGGPDQAEPDGDELPPPDLGGGGAPPAPDMKGLPA
jgi:hypothetical protein